jgi:hypothetical protein
MSAKYSRGSVIRRKIQHEFPTIGDIYHYGIVIDPDTVVHVAGLPSKDLVTVFNDVETKVISIRLQQFEDGFQSEEVVVHSKLSKEQIARNAEVWVNKTWFYNVGVSNCESFANLCAIESPISFQSSRIIRNLYAMVRLFYQPPVFSTIDDVLKFQPSKNE